MPGRLELPAPAKLNLCLRVVGRRADGYHELLSLFQPLALADRIILRRTAGPSLTLHCPDSDLDPGPGNLAFRAAELFYGRIGSPPGLEITLLKAIPVAAGLGGGSSDAAAVLKGANRLAGSPLKEAELAELGLELGADVPFFLAAGPAWARGVGEVLTPVTLPPFHYLLINPGFGVSTGWAFKELRMPLTPSRGLAKVEVPSLRGEGEGLYGPLRRLPNDLEPVVEKAWPVVARLKELLSGAGAKLARMSGSGPTVFGLFETEAEATRAAASLLKEAEDQDLPWRILLTRGLT